jgi:hypothetical protein
MQHGGCVEEQNIGSGLHGFLVPTDGVRDWHDWGLARAARPYLQHRVWTGSDAEWYGPRT